MSSSFPLQHLLQVVPVCQATATLGELWFMFYQSQCDRIVVVNQQQQPQGLVYLHRLLPHLFALSPPVHATSQQTPVSDGEQGHSLKMSLDTLQQTLTTQQNAIIDPLLKLPRSCDPLELGDYLPQLIQTAHPAHSAAIAFVDESNQFLGLLDPLALLHYWTDCCQQTEESKAVSSQVPVQLPRFLQHLLEQFPIPVMIQTDQGQVIAQNWAWRSRLESSSETVRQTAETVVHFDPTAEETEIEASPSDHGVPLPNGCHMGAQPDTYICICQTATEQEQVWQFARQPLQHQWSDLFKSTDQLSSSPQFWLVLAQDVTEQHRVAQELAAKNADLVHLNRLKDEFLACISHELKTPLTAILGLSKLLNEPSLGHLSDRQAHYAQLIYQSGRHLMMVVNDILDLTRMETGQLELSPSVVKIEAVCDQAFEGAVQQQQEQHKSQTYQNLAEALQQAVEQTRQRFTLEIDPGLDHLIADELRLRQMLGHLLSNALKFTPDQSAFGLRVSHWDQWIAFTVWDQGIGIPEDKQHLIFQKFQQVQSPLTREYQGTGLGLVLTQRLAHLHGGDVSFISQVGQGSQFTLLLPPSPPQNALQPSANHALTLEEKSHPAHSHDSSHSRLVLIVEAVPQFTRHLSAALHRLGYRVVIARSGTEAIEKARCLQPHVIFLNPLLPLLSGWDVLTLLKTDTQTHQIPVIVTATSGDKKRAVLNHCDGFLCLPVQGLELEKLLIEIEQKPVAHPVKSVTILWLNPIESEKKNALHSISETETKVQQSALMLHHCSHCRVIESDDLVQAELLARIWQPDAVILQSLQGVQDPDHFSQQLIEQERLSRLPWITLDAVTTQLIHQIKSLSVFPCIAEFFTHSNNSIESALLQVIQRATGTILKAGIVVIDSFSLSPLPTEESPTSMTAETIALDQALVRYLETAGFRSIMAQTWSEVLQQMQSKTVDLLLICVRNFTSTSLLQGLQTLEDLTPTIPILLWDQSDIFAQDPFDLHQSFIHQMSVKLSPKMQQVINHLGIQVLPRQTSMVELLNQIRQYF